MNAPDKLNQVKNEAQGMIARYASWPARTLAAFTKRLENLHQSNFEMGVDFADRGQLKDALFRFKMAVYFRPRFVEAWYNLGVTHMRLGETRQAKIALKKALSLRKGQYPEATYMLATMDLASLPPEQRPTQMPKNMMQGFFAQAAPVYNQMEAQNGYQGGAVVCEALRPHLRQTSDLTIMDVGCGTGLASIAFRNMAKTLIGIDVTPGMVEQARGQHNAEGNALFDQVHEADIRALPDNLVAGGGVDVVLCVNVTQFVGELTQALHYMAWLLKPGGILALTIEPCGGESYGVMQKTARFAHSEPYVRERAAAVNLTMVETRKLMLYPNMGSLLCVLQKPEAA